MNKFVAILSVLFVFFISPSFTYAANVVSSSEERAEMRRLATTDPLNIKAKNEIIASADRALSNNHIDPTLDSFVQRSLSAVHMGYAFDITGDTKYANGTIKAILTHTNFTPAKDPQPNTELTWGYNYTLFAHAYSLVENYSGFSSTDKTKIKNHFRAMADTLWSSQNYLLSKDNCITNMKWFKVAAVASLNAVLQDTIQAKNALNLYKQYLNSATGHCWDGGARVIDAQGYLGHEMARYNLSGVNPARDNTWYYSGFSMSGMVAVVEIARHQGINLWDYTTPDGRNFKQVFNTHVKHLIKNGTPWPHKNFASAAEWPFIFADYPGTFEAAQAFWGGTNFLPVFENKSGWMSDSLRPKVHILTGPAVYMYHGRRLHLPGSTIPTTNPNTQANPSPTGTVMHATLFLHGIGKGGDNVSPGSTGNTNPLRKQRTVIFEILDANNQLVASPVGTVHYDTASGSFKGAIAAGNLTPGVYTLKVKMDQYLKKGIPGIISITAGQIVQLPATTLITGNVNNDNAINIIDFNLLLDCFSSLLGPKNCSDANKKIMTDLTDDGNVNEIDYNLFLRELSVQGGN